MGKVLGIFLHQLTSRPRRVFLYVQPIHSSSTVRDEILDLPILKLDMMNDDVIGLSAVEMTKLFMVPVSTVAREDGESGSTMPWNDEFTYSQKYEVNGVKGARCSLNGKVGLVQCDAFLTNTYKFTPRLHTSREVHFLP